MTRAPGPKGSAIWGSLAAFKADPLACLTQAARDHGDVVRLRFGPVTAHLINRPDLVEQVLSRNGANYDKATRSARRIAAATGNSLLSADHVAWQRHRRLIQPAFQPRRFAAIGPVIDTLLDPMLERWRQRGTIDIVDEMMQLVIAAAIKILFSADIDAGRFNACLAVLLADTWRRIEAPVDASMLSPRLHRPAFKAAVAEVNAIVFDLIQNRRRAAHRPDDVLTDLLAAHEAGGDIHLSDQELRDAALTLLLAGHETTATALAWSFVHSAGADGETADPAHIFAESLRLHPSIWVIERRVIAGDTLGGYDIPRGSSVLISPWLLHRHPGFWTDPSRFDPSRFAHHTPRPRDAYLPFGLGQHRCVGLHLASTMATHIITRVYARFRLHLMPGQTLDETAEITLRPTTAIRMRVEDRPL
ncbi:cytochrome P450 [Phaeovulum sp. W22_SRMD_FR3]|uniref:cytochrome P450 n=1 Tax=Phaeovulum sp. W22_SRMD_FR3 TaxID=3240274 RepID=UPI003F9A8B85